MLHETFRRCYNFPGITFLVYKICYCLQYYLLYWYVSLCATLYHGSVFLSCIIDNFSMIWQISLLCVHLLPHHLGGCFFFPLEYCLPVVYVLWFVIVSISMPSSIWNCSQKSSHFFFAWIKLCSVFSSSFMLRSMGLCGNVNMFFSSVYSFWPQY
jgi:hypothetical protein